MSPSVAKKLVQYRNWAVAVINAAITWMILIIAPLGLFAVITCTVAVFFTSLLVGWLCDRALFQLLRSDRQDVILAERDSRNIGLTSPNNLDLPTHQQRQKHQ